MKMYQGSIRNCFALTHPEGMADGSPGSRSASGDHETVKAVDPEGVAEIWSVTPPGSVAPVFHVFRRCAARPTAIIFDHSVVSGSGPDAQQNRDASQTYPALKNRELVPPLPIGTLTLPKQRGHFPS